MRTHPDDKLLEQHCYKSVVGLLQLVRFYVCTKRAMDSICLSCEQTCINLIKYCVTASYVSVKINF